MPINPVIVVLWYLSESGVYRFRRRSNCESTRRSERETHTSMCSHVPPRVCYVCQQSNVPVKFRLGVSEETDTCCGYTRSLIAFLCGRKLCVCWISLFFFLVATCPICSHLNHFIQRKRTGNLKAEQTQLARIWTESGWNESIGIVTEVFGKLHLRKIEATMN